MAERRPGYSIQLGPDRLLRSLGIDAANRRALFRAAVELQKAWKLVLNQPGHGELYDFQFRTIGGKVVPLPKRKRPAHRASEPGEPPAPDTAKGRESILVEQDGDELRVGTRERYLLALEFGVNVAGSAVGPHPDADFTIEPRPHARVAYPRAKEAMRAAYLAEVRRQEAQGGGQ